MATIEKPLITIVGPTASGKTGIAIKLAQKFNGEIISADSRAIYKFMDIGTAKPTSAEQREVPHWGIDLVEPDQKFTAADFQKYTNEKIREIRDGGKIPFLVGGSGLYVDSVIYNYEFGEIADEKLRTKLEKKSVEELQKYCKDNNISLPENYKNKRYLIRAIEQKGVVKNNHNQLREDTIVVGISTDKEELRNRISARAKQMFDGEIEKETDFLAKRYSFDLESMKSNIYSIVHRMMNGEISRNEAIQLSEIADWHLAKKQMTWFRRNSDIKWLTLGDIEEYISSKLN